MSIYQVVTRGQLGGVSILRNVAHYEFAGYVPSASEIQEFVDGLDDTYKTHLRSSFHTYVTIQGYGMRRVDVADQPESVVVPTNGSWAGTNATNMLPAFCSLLVTFKATTTFPRTTRTYLFPMGVSMNGVGGDPTATALANAGSWAASVLEISITGQTDADKVAVRYSGDPRAVTDENDVTSWLANPLWSPLRSRKTGVGN